MRIPLVAILAVAVLAVGRSPVAAALQATVPDGRVVTPAGFTIPVAGFASEASLSPDGRWLAVLSLDAHAIDVIDARTSVDRERIVVDSATAMTWTGDGLFVAQGFTGRIARFAYAAAARGAHVLERRGDLAVGAGLLDGIAEDATTHRIAVTRTAAREVAVLDASSGAVTARFPASGQPFDVAFVGGTGVVATLYDSDHVDAWQLGSTNVRHIATGPHPTRLLVAGGRVFVANADGHDVVALDAASLRVLRRYELAVTSDQPPGQTPAGMVVSADTKTLFVAESGFNDVAALDVVSGRLIGRIPAAWYPMALAYVARPVGAKDARVREQLWIANAKGLGSQPDPAAEWNGTYAGLVQHLVVDRASYPGWSATVARNDRFVAAPVAPQRPPIRHVVVIVRENKQFDEVFGDEPQAAADPTLLLYGRSYTPNAHALAERYTLFDNFMSDGEASIYGHAWLTQGMANDYHERNARSGDDPEQTSPRVAWSIWPLPAVREDALTASAMDFDWFRDLAQLTPPERVNVSGIFGPRGELVDEFQRRGIGYRVYGDQLTMLPSGKIAPGLAADADRTYPGTHIDFGIRDTTRAQLFLDDVAAHGLAPYNFLTLPTDHTAGSRPGFLTPSSFVANNDTALGEIVAGLSKRPEWHDTIVFVTPDDAQGTGDHVDAHRMPVFAAGPFVRRGFVDHTQYALPSILRTVELAFGLAPLTIYDAGATPIDAFALQPNDGTYDALVSGVPLVTNPGTPGANVSLEIDGPGSAEIPNEEWASIKGVVSLEAHEAYVRHLDGPRVASVDP